MIPADWMQHAACRGLDPNLFFPSCTEDIAPAKAICRGCVVREPCLEYALANHEHHGVWGGCSERERRRIRRQRGLRAQRTQPIEHGAGTSAYMRCRAVNGDACVICKLGHARQCREADERRRLSS